MSSDVNYEYGRWLASPPPGDEVVISGMSGRLPESNNIYEFRDHLFNKEDMVTSDGRRWELDHPDIPKRFAKLCNIDKYDAGYFGLHHRQANLMDPVMRMTMEVAIEAIMDAGVDPRELEGTKTGVFISMCWSNMDVDSCGMTEPGKFDLTGNLRSLISHQISYFLKLKGPGFTVDTACSSTLNAVDSAFRAIRSGQCDKALVAGSNLVLHPGLTLQFFRLGLLSKDGTCRVFDENASGYVRAETVACIFLEKLKDSKRVYARIMNAKSNVDGFKEQGILFPSIKAQKTLMTEIYDESGIDPSQLCYLEAHGTGTQIGDLQEAESIDWALAQKRTQPLLIGSVKSSIGHSEPASGLCSIIKVVLAMETGYITPNIHFKKNKKELKGLDEGRIKVVTEVTQLCEESAIIGVNNFGFGGNNAHIILKSHNKTKTRREPEDDLPRLVCVSGRSEAAVQKVLNQVNITLDEDYVALLHQLYKKNTNIYRGFTIMGKKGSLKTSVTKINPTVLYIFFGQFTKNFKLLCSELLQFRIFKKSIIRINKILQQNNSCTLQEILQDELEPHQNILGSICVQVAFVDTLKTLQIYPTAIYPVSYAKLVTNYYNDLKTLQETISEAIKTTQLDINLNLQVPTETAEDKVIHQTLAKLPKTVTLLNISDTHLNKRDLLLVDNQNVKFLETLGRLFQEGHNPQIHELYPKVKFPVSRGTPMVSPFIQWHHNKLWKTYIFNEFRVTEAEQREYSICYLNDEYKFISGHVIDERNLFPATGYLHLVWQTLAGNRRLLVDDVSVVFKNCKFIKAIPMPKTGLLYLLVTIQRGTGHFEILEKNTVVVTGSIHIYTDTSKEFTNLEEKDIENSSDNIMEKDEIYKELYLRGYNYSGDFKGIEKYNSNTGSALVKWEKNWTTFIDKLLQLQILNFDSRLLFVPVGIKKLVIDPAKHIKMAEEIGDKDVLFPAYTYKDCGIIKSGGIEISGLNARSILRKKPKLLPVLEKNVFVPNVATLELQEAIRVNTQIILENSLESHFKAVEIVEECSNNLLLPLVSQALDDVPVVNSNLTVSTDKEVEDIPGVKIEVVTLTPESNLLLVVGTNLLKRLSSLTQLLKAVKENGFVLSREDVHFVGKEFTDLEILTEYQTANEKLILLRKSQQLDPPTFIHVSSSNFQWLDQLKSSLTKDSNIVLFAKNQEPEGLLGFVNCIRREPNRDKVRCVFVMDDASSLAPGSLLLTEQLKKNFAINIFKENTWGTYKHLLLEPLQEIESEHCYANVTSRGDISSLKWLQGTLTAGRQ